MTDRPAAYKVTELGCPARDVLVNLYRESWSGDGGAPVDIGAKYDWLRGNPAGLPTVFELTVSDGEEARAIGMIILVPRRLSVNGRIHSSVFPCEFVIHSDYRGALPAVMLLRDVYKSISASGSILYAIPNERSLPIFRRLTHGGTVIVRHRWARPARFAPYLSRHLPRSLASILGPLVDAIDSAKDRVLSLASSQFRVVWAHSFDERFDDLWERVAQTRDIIGERNAAFLGWRFGQEPGRDNRILVLERRSSGRLGGYIVGGLQDGIFTIRDMCMDLSMTRMVGALAMAMGMARVLGADSVSLPVLALPRELRVLRISGFRQREAELVFVVVRVLEHGVVHSLTRADEDV